MFSGTPEGEKKARGLLNRRGKGKGKTDEWELNEDGELEGQWRIRREEVGGKERQVQGDSKRRPKRTQNRLFKYLYT